MKSRIIFVFIVLSNSALAKDYCPGMPEAVKEGDPWYMPESEFTKDAANKAIKELSSQINYGVEGRDFMINNQLTIIKGHLYLAYLAEHKKQFGKDDSILVSEFCKFMREEARVYH